MAHVCPIGSSSGKPLKREWACGVMPQNNTLSTPPCPTLLTHIQTLVAIRPFDVDGIVVMLFCMGIGDLLLLT